MATSSELIESHLWLVKLHARKWNRYLSYLRPVISEEDLYQEGCLGLINAAAQFKPECGKVFTSYAYLKIRFALLDVIRRHNQYRSDQTSAVEIKFYSLSSGLDSVSEDAEPSEDLYASDSGIQAKMTEREVLLRQILDTHVLPLRDRQMIHEHYWQDLTITQVAAKHGISVPWACQTRSRICRDLAA